MLLHKPLSQSLERGDSDTARETIRRLLSDSLVNLEEKSTKHERSIRWELGACWVQHLQNLASEKTDSKKNEEAKNEQPVVKGLGKQFGLLKGIKKVENKSNLKENSNCNGSDSDVVCKNSEKEMILQDLLSDNAFRVLKESKTGLHIRVQFFVIFKLF